MAENYKLRYFNMRGRGEPIRLIFALANVEFEDIRVKAEEWPALKQSTPWGQLPTLEIDGKIISQTLTILRFLARRFNLAGSNEFEATQCDEIADAGTDLSIEWIKYEFEKDEAKKAEYKQPLVEITIPKYLNKFEAIQIANGGDFLVGQSVTWADLWVANILENLQLTIAADILESYPNLKKLKDAFFAIPSVKAWIDKRPPPP